MILILGGVQLLCGWAILVLAKLQYQLDAVLERMEEQKGAEHDSGD